MILKRSSDYKMTTQLADSSVVSEETVQSVSTYKTHSGQLTPKEILSWLPANATPAQQDSAIQAHIKPGKIHYSSRPDTLHLPGHKPGKSLMSVSLPTYYKESFFSKSPLFHPELPGGRLGVAGDPVPYTLASDNLITGVLLGCFVLATLAFSKSQRFIYRQVKDFFFAPRIGTTTITETSTEVRYQMFFVLQTCLLLTINFFFFTRTFVSDTFTIDQFKIMGVNLGVVVAYYVFKFVAYWFTGWVFFDSKKTEQWLKSFIFLVSTEGVLLFPVVLLLVYFDLPIQSTFIYTAFVIILVKILSFYKSYSIFFKRIGAILQFILYFCALEIMPLAALWGALIMISNYLKINF